MCLSYIFYMKINFSPHSFINPVLYAQNPQKAQSETSFGSVKAKKLIEKVRTAKNLKNINATFEDMVTVYKELGYNVIMKRGSHAVIPITEKVNLPLVIPHNSKFVHIHDLKRLQYIVNGEIEKALKVH